MMIRRTSINKSSLAPGDSAEYDETVLEKLKYLLK